MASPTRWLRKHSKIMMVFVAVFAMAIFGLGSVFDQFVGGRGSTGPDESFKEVVATWDGGKITRGDLSNLYRQHYQVQRFLEEVSERGRKLKGEGFRPLARIVPRLQAGERSAQSFIDMELIEKFLFAKKAEKEGVVIGDALVDAYVDLISGTSGFSRNDLAQINRDVNQRVSLESVYSQLKMELAAQQMRSFSFAGFHEVPNPTEAAELYRKYMESIELEVMALPVEEFVSKVPAPPLSELKTLFEQGKYEFADPFGKRPGFKKPHEVALQYVYADFDTTLTNHINRLTDEEVQAEYDRLVQEKSNLVIQRVPKENSPPATGEGESDQDGPPTLPGEEQGTGAEGTGEAQAEESSDGRENTGSTGGEAEKTEGAPTADGNAGPDAGDEKSPLQFISFVQDETPRQEQQNPPQGGTEQQGVEQTIPPQENPPAETNQAETNQAETAQQGSEGGSQPPTTESPTAPLGQAMDMDLERLLEQIRNQQGDSMFADDQEFEEKILPLVEVADRVKRNMVFDKVMVEISETMEKAATELGDFQIQISVWESLENQAAVEKPNLDLRELANRYGLIYDEVPLSDAESFQQTDFGKVMFSYRDEMGRTRTNSITELIFFQFDQLKEFNVNLIDDGMTGNSYAYWITEKVPAKVLTFEQAKDRVERFWKNRQALRLAELEAEEKANSINTKEQLLSEAFGDQVKNTGEFTWVNLFGGSRYGEPFGVESPGEEFMQVAFSLKPREAAVAVNGDRSVVYVIQLLGERRSMEQVGTEFIENRLMATKRIPFEAERVSSLYIQEEYFEWRRQLLDEMGMKLVR